MSIMVNMEDTHIAALVAEDLPKGTNILLELAQSLSNAAKKIESFRNQIENGDLKTEKGLSLLELKNQSFVGYLSNLSYITLLKLSGMPLENHPAIDRLIEHRVLLEKLRPLEKKCKYQIDKYIKLGSGLLTADQKMTRKTDYMSNIADESDEIESEDDEVKGTKKLNKGALYKAPKIIQKNYPGDKKAIKETERQRKRLLTSSTMEDALFEYADDPEIVYNRDALKKKALEKMSKIQSYEEDNFVRVQLSKKEMHGINQLSTAGNMEAEMLGFRAFLEDGEEIQKKGKKRKSGTNKIMLVGKKGKSSQSKKRRKN